MKPNNNERKSRKPESQERPERSEVAETFSLRHDLWKLEDFLRAAEDGLDRLCHDDPATQFFVKTVFAEASQQLCVFHQRYTNVWE